MPNETVIALRKQLREKFPSAHRREGGQSCPPPQPRRPADAGPHRPTFHFSLSTLHSREAGSLPGSITEISPAHPSCGLSLIVAALLAEEDLPAQSETAEHGPAEAPLVLIDARDRFDPASLSDAECARLLWLRCRDTTQALQSADLLLRDGNLPFILLDLSALPARELRRIPTSSWHRLRQLAESTATTLLALTPTPIIPRTSLRLTLTRELRLDDLQLSRPELLATLRTETTRHLHHTRSA